MSIFSKLFGGHQDDEKQEMADLYNQAHEADLGFEAMHDIETQVARQGYTVHWNSVTHQFELMED